MTLTAAGVGSASDVLTILMVQHIKKAIEFPAEKGEVIILRRVKLMDILSAWPRGNFVVMGWDSFLSFVFSAWVSTKL
ncbi:hypothetical protein Hanom_Chr06g00566661 [Helianthus anomalus]